MTQPPYPPSPYPPMPYHPHARQPPDPAAPAKRASVLMWVLGTCVVLSGLCFAAAVPALTNWMLASGPPAEVEQLRRQIALVESQGGAPFDTQLVTTGIVLIVIGGSFGTMAFFVRGGGRGATVTAAVIVGLAIAFFALNFLYSLSMGGGNPAQRAMSFCFALGVFGTLGTLMHWLLQAARNAPQVEAARRWAHDHGGQPPDPYAWQREHQRQQQAQYPPPPPDAPAPPAGPTAHVPYQPPAPPASPPPASPFQPHPPLQPPTSGPLFGPAPFGIPPPPDEAAPGRYGYATRPTHPATGPAAPDQASGPAPAAERPAGPDNAPSPRSEEHGDPRPK